MVSWSGSLDVRQYPLEWDVLMFRNASSKMT